MYQPQGETAVGGTSVMTVKNKALSVFIAMMLAVVGFCVAPTMALADLNPDGSPLHDKTLADNEDGTFKLELSVTGDADTETEEAGKVNVLVVYDTSSSMTSNAQDSNYSRADQAEDVVHDFLTNLARYQNDAKDNINVALVTFARFTDQHNQGQTWTTNVTGLANRFEDGGTDRQTNFSYSGTQSNGTNWEAALDKANDLVGSAPGGADVPTFVIMMTDGACTASGNGNNAIAPTGATIAQLRNFYSAATDDAREVALACEATGGTFYGIYAYGTEADLLDDLMYFSENGQHRGGNINNVVAATQDAPNFFLAANTAALNDAIEQIFQKIIDVLGISSVAISDGTTNQVQTSTEVAELLEVDEDSYQYWLKIPIDGNNQFQRISLASGDPVTYTVSSNGSTVSWGSNNVTVNGEIVSEGGQRYLKYEWKEANALYDAAPPDAKFESGAVNWDLSSVGTLLDGVTYSVTFDCYPSQTTLDIVADIKNDPGTDGAWGDLDPEIQKYIDVKGNLSTNTTAKLTYTDTRTGDSGKSTYENPGPVKTAAVEEMAVSKQWDNAFNPDEEHDPIILTVTRDGEDTYEVNLSKDNDWTDNVFISIGIMRTDDEGAMEVLKGSEGHDFTFAELGSDQYHWELDVPVVHPMMINGVPTMLIKVDEKHPVPEGADTYEINGSEYYVDDAAVSLNALNEHRSRLLLTKEVTGEGAPEDAEFPFTINVVNSKAPEAEPTDDPKHDSDYWVWISARDKDGKAIEGIEGATQSSGSWWYAPSGTDVTIPATAGCSILINNLPTGTTYTITEGDLEPAFIFDKAEIAFTEGEEPETAWTFEGDKTSTGSIDTTNAAYTITYTNKYEVVDVSVKKVWDDAKNQDKIRPDELALTLNGLPEGAEAPEPTITKNDDETEWTYTWKKLPKYDSQGEEIEYTVTEDDVPDGYECEGSPADPDGIITNKHTPVTAEAEIKVTKAIEGADWPEGKTLTFTLAGSDGAPMPEEITATLEEAGTVTFGPITYTMDDDGKEYSYTITEDGFGGVWTGTPGEITATVSVAKNDEGGLSTTVTYDPEDATITNKYAPTPVSVDPPVQKVIEGTEDLYNKGDFTFTIENTAAPEGVEAPMPTNTVITNSETYELEDKQGFYEFGEITFTDLYGDRERWCPRRHE